MTEDELSSRCDCEVARTCEYCVARKALDDEVMARIETLTDELTRIMDDV
jgi:hypothetical protein